jgi:ABC-type dipeptide/oligopeptide/nickel transport system permease subunit
VTGRLVAAAYVATVAGLTAAAFSSHEGVVWAEVAAGILALPALVPALPVIYVLGAVVQGLVDSPGSGSASSWAPGDPGGPVWPVTLTFTVLMTLVACVNVELVRLLRGRSA